ncbi:hypothetical protein C1646_772210 [Rhizophagus diaphanus]|nr:hypothetical protein C1646_772210 [Rhizophagus diaphanus] [Rhizophagus sp. MUCL 43196]
MYGRDIVLPIEFAISTAQMIVDRLETQDNICKAQQKQKEQHYAGLSKVQFKIGDLVLLYQSQLRGKQKLQERWKGHYYVHDVTLENNWRK